MGEDFFEGTGSTALEALQSIPRPMKFRKALVRIEKGDKSKEMVFFPIRLRKLFFTNIQHQTVRWLTHQID